MSLKEEFSESEDERIRREKIESTLWDMAGTLYAWRRFIVGMTLLFAALTVILCLFMPKWYKAETRLLSPESSGTNPLSAALSSNLSAAASALLGRSGGDYFRYIAILSSRSMLEKVVDTYGLTAVYETEESRDPMGSAVSILAENSFFEIDNEYEFLSVEVFDLDPQRAADIANFYVEELNHRNQELASQDAANYRRFVEKRFHETLVTLDSLKNDLQHFQEEFGVFDLETQAEKFLEQVADMRAEALALEIEYAALRAQYGISNPRVEAVHSAYVAANRQSKNALAGLEEVFPVSKDQLPGVSRTFLELQQEVLIQTSILEIIAPMYEQARFQEERIFQAVQVVDRAVPPTRKAKPKRSIIVIAATLSAFVLVVFYVLAYSWWRQNYVHLISRLRASASKSST